MLWMLQVAVGFELSSGDACFVATCCGYYPWRLLRHEDVLALKRLRFQREVGILIDVHQMSGSFVLSSRPCQR